MRYLLLSVLPFCVLACGESDETASSADPTTPGHSVYRVAFSGFDDRDSGLITGRALTINKKSASAWLRLTYYDSLGAHNPAGPCACRWEVLLNGSSCSAPGAIALDLVANAVERLQHATVQGWCDSSGADTLGVEAVSLTVSVGPVTGSCDCKTGFFTDDMGFLEAEEIE
ncbi:MAG: hypothetical protein HY903_22775 [Deltaproteobacteria bacterium]|nr:hypothetical protein [Deltaproteobacteria bacterium]